MATVTKFTAPGDTFSLGMIFQQYPDVAVELDRIVPTNESIIPYCWVRGADEEKIEQIEASFRGRPDLQEVRLIDEVDGQYLLRVEWNHNYRGILGAIAGTDVNLISGRGTGNEWEFEIRSEDRKEVSEFQRYCQQHDLSIELTAVHALSKVPQATEYDLTEPQREALLLAYESGYFDTPRESTLDEIAVGLDITRQALASRLRRGYKNLVQNTLVND